MPAEAPEGYNIGFVESRDDVQSPVAGFVQTFAVPLTANTTYTVTVGLGNSMYYPTTFPGYSVQLVAGGNVLAEDNDSLTVAKGQFATSTVSYTPAADNPLLGAPVEIRLLSLAKVMDSEVEFDSVSVEAKLPAGKALIAPTTGLYVQNGVVYDNYQLDIGHGDWTGDARAMVKYDLSSLPVATIASATLYLLQSDLETADQDGQAQLRRIGTSDWDGTKSAAVLNALVADAESAAVANFSPAANPAPGLYSVDVTSVVRAWADGSQPNYGFGLMQASEGLNNTGRQFGANPMLLIEFLIGDANGDVVVDAADYIALKANFGMTVGASLAQGNFDADIDGNVDWDDLQILMANFSTRTIGEAPAVPEPGSVMLLMFGAAALLLRRKA